VCSSDLGAAGCAVEGVLAKARDYERSGNVFLAYHTVEEAWEDESNRNQALDDEYWRLRKAYLLYVGKEAVFDEDEAQGIAYFNQVLAIDPDNELAQQWIAHSKRKLAKEAVADGDSHRFAGELEEAMQAYARAMKYLPGYAPAEEGQREVNQYFQERINKSEGYVRDGRRDYDNRRFPQSFHGGVAARDYDPASLRARQLYIASKQELIQDNVRLAKQAQELGNYHAALQRYREAEKEMIELGKLEASAVSDELRREMEKDVKVAEDEVLADELATKAAMKIARAVDDTSTEVNEVEVRLDEADALLEEAYEKSSFQRPRIGEYRAESRERRWDSRYRRARDKELFGDYQQALEAYREIDAAWADGFRDVKARISSLEADIELAEESYQKGLAAEEAGKLEEAIDLYREAVLFLRDYRGLDARIQELRTRIRPADPSGSEPDPSGDPDQK